MQKTYHIAGIDEAGRGPLAGPVVAGAVILHPRSSAIIIDGLADSKKLNDKQLLELAALIRHNVVAWSLGASWPQEIDRVNIREATKLAMARAVNTLRVAPRKLLIDGNMTINHPLPQTTVVKGDARVPAISAASILAKTFRDRLMTAFGRRYPAYGFENHHGYGSKAHFAAIEAHGPCPIHRMSFRPFKQEQKQFSLLG